MNHFREKQAIVTSDLLLMELKHNPNAMQPDTVDMKHKYLLFLLLILNFVSLILLYSPPQAEASTVTGLEEPQAPAAPSTGRPLSPRQRRAQQHSQQGQREGRDPASRPAFAPAARQPQDESHAGSAVLIVLLTLALAALIFRRIYLAQEYKFDYEL